MNDNNHTEWLAKTKTQSIDFQIQMPHNHIQSRNNWMTTQPFLDGIPLLKYTQPFLDDHTTRVNARLVQFQP